MEMEKEAARKEDFSVDLPAPPGWKKKFMPKQSGTPKKSEIIFTAPTGEEFTSKRPLEQYLKAHPGNPPASEFNWSTSETPRRSSRISEKAKAAPPPEREPPKKRSRKLSDSKKESKETQTTPDSQEATKETDIQEAEKAEKKDAEVQVEVGATEEAKPKQDANTSNETGNEKAAVGTGVLENNEEQGKAYMDLNEEKKYEVEEENKEEHNEGEIKEAAYGNSGKPDCTGVDEIKGKAEDGAVENGSNASKVNP